MRNLENGHQALRDEEKMKLSEKIEDLINGKRGVEGGGERRVLDDVSLLKNQGDKAVGRVKDKLKKGKRWARQT